MRLSLKTGNVPMSARARVCVYVCVRVFWRGFVVKVHCTFPLSSSCRVLPQYDVRMTVKRTRFRSIRVHASWDADRALILDRTSCVH